MTVAALRLRPAAPVALPSPRSEARVVGGVRVDWRLVRARLGRAATNIWAYLCSIADKHGVAVASVADVRRAGFDHLSVTTVEDALRRLRAFGLVSATRRRLVHKGATYAECRWEITRAVYGEWCVGGGDVCLVPRASAAKLQAAPGHGGARAGAGSGGARPGAGRKPGRKRGGGGGDDDERRRAREAAEVELMGEVLERPKRAAAPVSVLALIDTSPIVLPPPKLPPPDPSAPSASSPSAAFVVLPDGTYTDSYATAPLDPSLVSHIRDPRVVSSFALVTAVPTVRVPHPMAIPVGAPLDIVRGVLQRAYVGAVERACKVRRNPFAGTKKFDRLLDRAAVALMDRGVPPASWALFRADAWRGLASSDGGRLPPPVPFIFAPDAIERHWAWCRSVGYYELGGRIVWTPAGREYLARSATVERDFRYLRRAELTPERVRAWAEAQFPPAERRALVALARAEHASYSDMLRKAAARGEWIWP